MNHKTAKVTFTILMDINSDVRDVIDEMQYKLIHDDIVDYEMCDIEIAEQRKLLPMQ